MQGPGRIHILDEQTIAQIAAGEVIERPVSVVKELVENSLDAGAKSIRVELVDGGRTTISVQDDGVGIARDQLPVAVMRHATSKLTGISDLFCVRTLGFRGEGLASIAAAGRVEIVSRVSRDEFGARIEARGTRIDESETCAAPLGTKVTVRNLFSNTPARREFLKGPRAEFARVSAYLSRLALGWPQMAFALAHDGRRVWTLPAVSDAVDRLEMVFGDGSRGTLAPVDFKLGDVLVTGFVSRPGHDRPSRNHQTFFVNHRLVRSAALGAAWLAASGASTMTGRFGYGMLLVELPADQVDVNVHPTKIEVRFVSPAGIFEAVRAAVGQALRRSDPVREITPAHFHVAFERSSMERVEGSAAQIQAGEPFSLLAGEPAGSARVYGQIDRTYIVVADAERLLVIDQHAAHERIAYETLQNGGAGSERSTETQTPMLFPTVIELTPLQSVALAEFGDELAAAGVGIEPFGDGAYRITWLPAGYEKRRFDLAGMLDELASSDDLRNGRTQADRVRASVACHSVVRAHEPLSLQEQAVLYQRLLVCREPHTCPHGRPTMLRLDATSLEKAFRRT